MNSLPPPPAAPTCLRVESLVEACGLDVAHPGLSWKADSHSQDVFLSAYQIQVSRESDQFEEICLVWDTGRQAGGTSNIAIYGGETLAPRTRYWWRIRVWNNSDKESSWSSPCWFETGLMKATGLEADWIGQERSASDRIFPAPLLRRTFHLSAAISRARLYVTARGLFEIRLNGKKIGRDYFVPGFTNYNHTISYLTYDVTDAVLDGENALAAILGDGWFCGHFGWEKQRNLFGNQPSLCLRLEVFAADGTISQTILSDADWKLAPESPVQHSEFFFGETYDARLWPTGWDQREFDDSRWQPVACFPAPEASVVGKAMPPIRITGELAPVSLTPAENGSWIADFGQNISGWVRLRVQAARGSRIRLRFAEMLDADGSLYRENLRLAVSIDEYICAGSGEEVWEPRFTYHGFRFAEISGVENPPIAADLTACVLHSDLESASEFTCGHASLDKLMKNIRWGLRGNFFDIPTDCPQRDERMGWTGDAQIFVGTSAFLYDVHAFFRKWLMDLRTDQHESGAFPSVAPDASKYSWPFPLDPGAAGWADAGVICPWIMYCHYGDVRVLEENYDAMLRWIEFQRKSSDHLIRPPTGFGDWLSPDAVLPDRAPTPKDLIGTAFFARTTALVAKSARILGRSKDAVRLALLENDIIEAFNREFVTPGGRVVGDTQTGYAMALGFDLLEGRVREAAIGNLISLVERDEFKLATGFLGTPLLAPTLTKIGRTDLALKLVLQESRPGWLFPVLHGATTMWERWNSWDPVEGFATPTMNSFNHYAYGSIGEWIFRSVAGIDFDEDEPGFRHILMRPFPCEELGHLTAALQTPYGEVSSSWRMNDDGGWTWNVRIPANSRATAFPPLKNEQMLIFDNTPYDSVLVAVVGIPLASGDHILTATPASNLQDGPPCKIQNTLLVQSHPLP